LEVDKTTTDGFRPNVWEYEIKKYSGNSYNTVKRIYQRINIIAMKVKVRS